MTTETRVFNKYHKDAPLDSIYIGRGSPWGNPFSIGKDGTREEVVEKFEKYLSSNSNLLARVRSELRGKNLVCFCYPKACHGDILHKVANGDN